MQGLTARIRESVKAHGALGFALLCLRLPLVPVLKSDFGVRSVRAYQDWAFDRRFGVRSKAELGGGYDGSNPGQFLRIVQNLEIRYEDYAFVDFGSGKGRVLLLASAFPFRRIAGVEWSQELHEIALRNIDAYKGPRACNEVDSFCMDASELPIPSGKSVLYFFNPFGDEVMARVLDNVRRSFEEDPREIILAYMNPRCKNVFDLAPFLEKAADRGWFAVYKTVQPKAADRPAA
jgi:SAM-dependent methyltransferase